MTALTLLASTLDFLLLRSGCVTFSSLLTLFVVYLKGWRVHLGDVHMCSFPSLLTLQKLLKCQNMPVTIFLLPAESLSIY